MMTAYYCTIPVSENTTRNEIHKIIDRIYKHPDDHTACPRWSTNGSVVEIVSPELPANPEQVTSINQVDIPTGLLTLSFQYPAIRRKDGHLKVYDSKEIAKKQISEKVIARLNEMGMENVSIADYNHNIERLDLSDRANGVSKLPVSFIVAKCICNDEEKVRKLMIDGIGKFRFAGLGMVYVTKD